MIIQIDETNGEVIGMYHHSNPDVYLESESRNGILYMKVDSTRWEDISQCYYDFDQQDFVIRPLRPSECHYWRDKQWVLDGIQAMEAIRNERNRRLRMCDWTQMPDAPVANAEAWRTYRQELRDLPENCGCVAPHTEVDWPQEPS